MATKAAIMGSLSILHWVILIVVFAMAASPILGIMPGVQNGAVVHAVVSAFVPVYGLIYFFVAKQPRK
jgi:hypothetical protein